MNHTFLLEQSIERHVQQLLAERLDHARRRAAAAGTRVSSTPYGYVRDCKRIVPGPNAAHVCMIFRMAVDGQSAYAIANRLAAQGLPSPKGKRWLPGSIRRLLANPIYCGRTETKFASGIIIVHTPWTAVVDAELFEFVQANTLRQFAVTPPADGGVNIVALPGAAQSGTEFKKAE
jgi:site-specific DNA recombinase